MADQSVTEVSATDARRPRLVDRENPHLRELLRRTGGGVGRTEADEAPAAVAPDDDPLAPARGVLLGSAIGGSLWLAGGLAIWLLM